MKIPSMLIIAMAAGALGAQDAPRLDGRFQMFAELSRPAQIIVATPAPSPDVQDQPKRTTGIGFRFMGELSSAPGFYYELGGMFDASSNFTFNGLTSPGNSLNLTDVKVTDSYWTLGAAYMYKVNDVVTLGAHLEGRGEYLRIQGEVDQNGAVLGHEDLSTTYLRPWVRASADFTITSIGKENHPYVGLEGCYALMKTSQTNTPDFTNMDDRTLRSLAPKASAAIYAGVRF